MLAKLYYSFGKNADLAMIAHALFSIHEAKKIQNILFYNLNQISVMQHSGEPIKTDGWKAPHHRLQSLRLKFFLYIQLSKL